MSKLKDLIREIINKKGVKLAPTPKGQFLKNYDIESELAEEKKKADRCKRIADRKYDKPSAYKSGAIVRCRKGDIWKDLK